MSIGDECNIYLLYPLNQYYQIMDLFTFRKFVRNYVDIRKYVRYNAIIWNTCSQQMFGFLKGAGK